MSTMMPPELLIRIEARGACRRVSRRLGGLLPLTPSTGDDAVTRWPCPESRENDPARLSTTRSGHREILITSSRHSENSAAIVPH